MTPEQKRQEAYKVATMYTEGIKANLNVEVELSASATDGEGFDEVEDGIWVRAFIKVPANMVQGYTMTPPAPAAVVEAFQAYNYVQFRTHYVQAKLEAGDSYTEDDIDTSWRNYQRDPSGHFLHN